jgi:hypothetical protein
MQLGGLIKYLEKENPDEEIRFDFGYMLPTTLDSWRGVYAELALGYTPLDEVEDRPTVGSLLAECRRALGKSFYGYKGGDFLMTSDTAVWVDNYSECSNTEITHLSSDYRGVTINTRYVSD